jgi:hypothetical protein
MNPEAINANAPKEPKEIHTFKDAKEHQQNLNARVTKIALDSLLVKLQFA